ncbi:GPI transamidase subunit PIG-U [Kockovaella imperatae]|uniref:GPI transamidase subunit PIG-U n=1 Tax=Kockovaella imperatae TaxID=4999 RepID=A0A1Y1UCI9_9TREE|nr:GPI transamidase subunit PIG-U [Kockovaella imperatae]ORX35768.1 GPI transamidase subunit PIG-U [Kockovaella imperatae]
MTSRTLISDVSQRHKLVLVVATGILLRVYLLFGTSAHILLRDRPELSTPQTSHRSLKEGVFQRINLPLTPGSANSELYVAIFSHLIPFNHWSWALTWIAADLGTSIALLSFANSLSTGASLNDPAIVASYLLNPYSIAACIAQATTSLDNLCIVFIAALAVRGHRLASMITLGLTAHVSPYVILLLPSFVLIAKTRRPGSWLSSVLVSCAAYAGASYALRIPLWTRLLDLQVNLKDLTPNSGMWWYFFTEIFDHFRTFFLCVFQLHILAYVLPLQIRLKSDPSLVVLVMLGTIATWRSYPSLGDLGLGMSLLSCFPNVVSDLRHPLFTASVYLYTAILLPLLHALWLLTGTGNANFFYAATMVHGLNSSLAIVDIVGAVFRSSLRKAAGPVRPGRERYIVQLTGAQ